MNIHVKTASSYIKRSPFQTLAAVFVLTVTFFVSTLVAALVYSSGRLITYFETRPQIIAFIKNDATDAQISELQNKLSINPQIKELKYVSKSEALSIYKKATSDNPLLGELVSPSIFPASVEFSATDIKFADSLIDQVKNESIVDSVGFTASLGGEKSLGEVVGRLKTVSFYIRLGGGTLTLILAMASFALLLTMVTMRVSVRRDEIEILRLIGATKGFIRSPIIYESLFYSVTGVILGWMLAFATVLYSAPGVVSYFGEISILPKGIPGILILFGEFLAVELLLGVLLALSGSFLAISRARKVR